MNKLSDFEFRQIKQEERASFDGLIKYVFANSSKEEDEYADWLQNEWTTAAFHNGKIVATSGGFPLKIRMNGKAMLADGLTAVGTEPGYRRKGLVREMVTRRLHQVHEDDNQCASALWASMGAIYQRFGYGLASTHSSLQFDPRFVGFQFGEEPSGYVRLVDESEGTTIVHSLYRHFIEERSMALHRAEGFWQGTFGTKKSRAHCAVYFNSKHQPEGYVSFRSQEYERRADDPGPNQRIRVRDFIYDNIEAYRGLWEFIRRHDLVGDVRMDVPLDDPAFHMLLEPSMLQQELWDGVWLRLVDVDMALTCRNYGLSGQVCFEIREDPICPWNKRKYLMETDGETTEVSRTRNSAHFRITVNGLACLLSGNLSLSQLDRIGRAEVVDQKQLVNLDTMFATKHKPYCFDGF